mmetsp:Transcript_16175/g.35964  ORF Transcript_16175/g.35964 Transcript_16175/m.35964 type:complete len:276 (-) Transcript_16175:100-927(-)
MDKKLIKLAVKHADKIDPSLVSSLNKAGLNVPGINPRNTPQNPTPSAPPYAKSTATCNPHVSCPPQPQNPASSSSAYTYAPVNTSASPFSPIAPQYATAHPTELYLKEKAMSWTGDDAKIKDSSGNTVFKIHAELLTLSQRRYLVDAHGNRIGQLRHKKMDIKPAVYIGTLDNEKKVKLTTSGMFNPLKCDARIKVDGTTVGKVTCRGNWRAKKFSITMHGVEVATIGRKRTMASTFMDADSYHISVRPQQGQPVDLAFISLITIALDELYHEKE